MQACRLMDDADLTTALEWLYSHLDSLIGFRGFEMNAGLYKDTKTLMRIDSEHETFGTCLLRLAGRLTAEYLKYNTPCEFKALLKRCESKVPFLDALDWSHMATGEYQLDAERELN